MGRATARPPVETAAAALKAPLFLKLVEQLDADERRIVLDLGAASTPMLALLGRFRCRVQIADLASDGELERLNAGVAPDVSADSLVAVADSLLPRHHADDRVDFVLCWDMLNHLQPRAITALMQAIAMRAAHGALAHALIVYSERSMAGRPGRYVPTDDCLLVNREAPGASIDAPRYSPEYLGRIMGGFAIEHARLLANGMQEFLFRLAA